MCVGILPGVSGQISTEPYEGNNILTNGGHRLLGSLSLSFSISHMPHLEFEPAPGIMILCVQAQVYPFHRTCNSPVTVCMLGKLNRVKGHIGYLSGKRHPFTNGRLSL